MNDNKTLLDIANTALATIGAKPISSFDDADSDASVSCSQMLKNCIEQAQSATDWQELKKTSLLVPTGNYEGDRGYEYNAPSDLLRVISVSGGETLWETQGNKIYIHADAPVKICYIRYSENPSEWSVHLRNLVVETLAANLVGPIKGEWGARYQMLAHIQDEVLPACIAANSNASPGGNFYKKTSGSYGNPYRKY